MAIGETEVGKVRDHIVAVQQLLLSHIAALDVLVLGCARATIEIAEIESDACVVQGKLLVAARLDAMLDELRDVCELPANDG